MKIAIDHLRRYAAGLPADQHELRELFDDLGLEVKRIEDSDVGPVFVLELLANRGDHHAYVGIARECRGRTGGALTLPESVELETGDGPIPVRIEDAEGCPLYTLTPVDVPADRKALEAPHTVPLIAGEMLAGDSVVDVSNLVNAELGQPTHAFDADTIADEIVIRRSKAGEQAHLLFTEKPVELPKGLLVIADSEKILAIAGVIGCEESKVTEGTTKVLLESACFDPVSVRKGARRLAVQTTASMRFERGSDPTLALGGAARVVTLWEQELGAKRTGPTSVTGDWTDPKRRIEVSSAFASKYFARDLSVDEIVDRLERYDFVCTKIDGDRVSVVVPPHRLWDVESQDDLHEEIAKSIGYNEFATLLPQAGLGAVPKHAERMKAQVETFLSARGFFEVFSDGFYDRSRWTKLGLAQDDLLTKHVEVKNALDGQFSLLKTNCLVHALEAVSTNLNYKVDRIRAYEWARTFHPDTGADNGVCRERQLLWLVGCGPWTPASWAGKPQPTDLFAIKGLVDAIGAFIGVPLTTRRGGGGGLLDAMHPHRRAEVMLGDRRVGVFGELHPEVLKRFKIKRARPYYLEIDRTALETKAERGAFITPPTFPPIVRSLAFELPGQTEAADVAATLRDAGPDWLRAVDIVDLFALEAARAVTFQLTLENDNQRSAEAINDAVAAAAAKVLETHANVKQR